jgi:D-alanyl-D-alanine carboxypeptidase
MSPKSPLERQLQALIDQVVDENDNIRNAVLLVETPAMKWKGASGMANPDEGTAMHADAQFNIDSIAKMMTATIVMKLVEAGKLGLTDRISQYLPDSLIEGLHVLEGRSHSDEISVRHLLNHSSGIADDWAQTEFLELIIADPQKRWTPEETIEFIKVNCQPAFPPGDGFQYSDPGYNLLGLITENIMGRALHEVYRDLLLDPLNMKHTYRPSHEGARESLPETGPSFRYLGDMECTLLTAVLTADWAGGGLISTTEDLNRFLRAFVRNEIFADPTTRDQMFKWIKSGPYHNYGFGISRVVFDRSDNPTHSGLGEIWGHRGSSDNFMFYWPQEDTTMIGTLNQIDSDQKLYIKIASIINPFSTRHP